jgi:hypothetical protein
MIALISVRQTCDQLLLLRRSKADDDIDMAPMLRNDCKHGTTPETLADDVDTGWPPVR